MTQPNRPPSGDTPPPPPPGGGSAGPPEELQREVQRLREENLYLRAELDNAGKRYAREKLEMQRVAAEGLIRSLVEVREDLERAAGSLREPAAADGVRMILAQLDRVLAAHGLEAVPGIGSAFDPFFHEAAERVASPQPEGTVVEEVRRGYVLHKRLLRPALVKVSTGPARHPGSTDPNARAAGPGGGPDGTAPGGTVAPPRPAGGGEGPDPQQGGG